MVRRACIQLLCVLVLLGALAGVQRADGAMYWGATVGGETYGETENAPANQAAWDLFERHAGKKVAILSQGQGWCTFDTTKMDATAARGAIPLVTMGLPGGVTLAEVAAGRQDAAIKQWAKAAKEWGRPFLFGPWWEMNGGWYPWGQSEDFVSAWQHFHDLVIQQGATNVTWTWIANSIWYDPASDPSPYYPGNAYVDWAGIDSYNWGLGPAQPDRWRTPDETITPTLSVVDELTHGEKPVLIAEEASSEYGGNKANWIREMLGDYLPHHPQIGAYVWFNWNPERNGIRYDWPIETSAPAQQAFREGIQSSVFVGGPQSPPPLTKVKPPPPAAGEPPRQGDLSPSSEIPAGPQMALAPDGSATVVWSARDPADPAGTFAVFARRLDPKGRPLAEPVQLSASGEDALDPHVAVGPDGTATVVWTRSDGAYFLAQMRRIGPGGDLGPTVDLSQTGQNASSPDVAVAPDGTAAVVWKRSDSSHHYLIKERHIAPDGTPEETSRTLSESGQDAVEPDVGIAGDDAATVVWSRFDGEDSIVQERHIAPDGTPAATVLDLSASGQSAVSPQVAIAPGGEATVVWDRFSGSNWIVQAVQLGSGGTPAGTLDLSAAGRDAAEPALAVDPDGNAAVVWDRFDGSAFVVQMRRITAAGAPGQAATLSESGRDAADPQVAVAGDGSAAVGWSRFDGSNWVVQERTVSAAGSLGATANLSAAGRSAGDPVLRWRPDGTLASLWRRFDGRGDVVQEPPPPPWPVEPAAAVSPPPATSTTAGGGGKAATRAGAAGAKIAASFRIGKPRLDRRRGTARLPVTVSGPGRLLVVGGTEAVRELRRAGTTVLRVRVRGAKRRRLQRHGTVRVRLRITFVPAGAEPLSRTVSIRLRKRALR